MILNFFLINFFLQMKMTPLDMVDESLDKSSTDGDMTSQSSVVLLEEDKGAEGDVLQEGIEEDVEDGEIIQGAASLAANEPNNNQLTISDVDNYIKIIKTKLNTLI